MRKRRHASIPDADQLFDPAALAEAAIRSNLDPQVFNQIDDRDIPWPRNWFEWVKGTGFLNINPFPKQIEVCINFYSQFCPRCTDPKLMTQDETWGNRLLCLPTDMAVANIQDLVTFLWDGVCPTCGVTKPELLENNELAYYINLAGVAGMRCAAGDTCLFTDTGVKTLDQVRCTNVGADTFQRLGVNVASLGKHTQASEHYTAGIGEALRITLQYGFEIVASPAHRVRVLSKSGDIELRRLDELCPNDAVQVVDSNLWGSTTELPALDLVAAASANKEVTFPSTMTPKLARILGNLVANGSVNDRYVVSFHVSDAKVRDRYIADTKELFNVTHYRDPNGRLEDGGKVETVSFCSVLVRRFLEQLGLGLTTAHSKQVPASILASPRECVIAFLGGAFDCDGGVYRESGGKRAIVSYTTVSMRLARQIQMLCLNLGIWLHLDTRPARAFRSQQELDHDAYFLTTKTLGDAKAFSSTVPLTGERQRIAKEIATISELGAHGPTIPNTRVLVLALMDRIERRDGSRSLRRFRHIRKQAGDVKRETLRRLLQLQYDPKLSAILDSPGRFMRVTCIESTLAQPLYDLHVPDGHLYVANGIVTHNSSKSVTVGGLIGTYQLARFLSLPSPSKYFGLMANQMLHGTFTAITATQCYDTLWQAFKDRIDNSPWFAQYHDFLKGEASRLDKEALYDTKDTYIWYGHKQLSFSYCGPDIRTIRGRTRICCVTGNTLLSTIDGFLPIGELAGKRPSGFSLLDLTVDTEHGPRQTTHFYRTDPVPLRRVETHHGYGLMGTPEHPVRILNSDGSRGYKKLKHLHPGDTVVLKRGASFGCEYQRLDASGGEVIGTYRRYRVPDVLTEDLSWLFGVVTAEGSVMRKNAQRGWVKFASGDREVIDKAVDVFRSCFGHAPEPAWGNRAKTYWRVACQSSRVARFFIDAGVCGHADTKTVPACILRSPRSVVAAFIRGYMDGDGHSDDFHLAAHSRSGELLQRIHTLLLGFGIRAYLKRYKRTFGPREKPANCTRTYWVIKIYGTELVRYHEEIGFTIPRKQVVKTNAICFEHVYGLDFSKVLSRNIAHGMYAVANGEPMRMNTTDIRRFIDRPTVHNLKKMDMDKLRALGFDLFAANLEDIRERRDLFYDKVVGVEDVAPEATFDLTVPDGHNFVANGIINHNSSIDEGGWFDVKSESSAGGNIRLNAEETHQALIKSLRTIRSAAMKLRQQGVLDPPDAINADVSSPSSMNDFIMRSLRKSSQNRSIYTFHYSTWEMNPNVTLESLRDEMKDPQAFERDYAAVPPLGANQFISSMQAVNKCASGPAQTHVGTWEEKQFTDEFGDTTAYLSVRPVRDKTKPRLLTVDTGLTNNSFALTLWSYDVAGKRPVCDMALECMPRQSDTESISVNFPLMFEHAIVPFLENLWVCLVVYDRWSSIEMVQRIRKDYRVEAQQYSLKYADLTQVRARVLDSSLVLPKLELDIEKLRKDDRPFDQVIRDYPVTHLAVQILTVREGGRKVIKPLNGTDDLFRCLCLAVKFMLDPKYTPRFERMGNVMGTARASLGVVRLNRNPLGQGGRGGTVTNMGVRKPYTTRIVK